MTESNKKYYYDDQGRKYLLLLRQDTEKDSDGNPQISEGWAYDEASINNAKQFHADKDPETAPQYLDFLQNWADYRGEDGKLEYKLQWDGIGERFPYNPTRPLNFTDSNGVVVDWMTWKQLSAPGEGVDFEPIDEGRNSMYYTGIIQFQGLHVDLPLRTNSYADGNVGPGWFYGMGMYNTAVNLSHFMGGLRAIPIVISNNQWLYHTKVALWLRVPP